MVRQRAGPEVRICAPDGPRGPMALQGLGHGFTLPLLLCKGLFPVLVPLPAPQDVETRGLPSRPTGFNAEFLWGMRNTVLFQVPPLCPWVPTWEWHPAAFQRPTQSRS